MFDPTKDEGVPLNVWLFNQDPPPTGAQLRRLLADRLIETYCPPSGVVVDLDPDGGEVLAAAASAGRSTAAVPPICACPAQRHQRTLEGLRASADLVVVLPRASRLVPPRPHALSPVTLSQLCRRSTALLRPGGFLVLGVVESAPAGAGHPLADAVHAAAPEGLAYFQHLVAVAATDLVDSTPASAIRGCGGPLRGGDRTAAHIDLLVLSRRGQ
ncbi:MAG TPA: hypothetical protein VNA57_07995 [Acidimicrobiales bacterium]|nr:hypothetical protein [Acidimicrobiales bacterium]